jgi:putative tryptophan/tyrosine transport system substrate-binding protein
MRRRDFITGITGSTLVWPINSRAQQARKLRTIGYLGAATLSVTSQWVAAFVQRLRELGWVDGHTVAIEFRWAEGKNDRYASIAAEFVQLSVDVIVTSGTLPVLAAKKATSIIPIVFASSGDPVGAGLVASLARPGGNVTGLALENPDLAGKQIELLREVVPGIRNLGILTVAENPTHTSAVRELRAAARSIGVEVEILEIKGAGDIAPAFESFKLRGVAALYIMNDPLVNTNRVQINTLAITARSPTIYPQRDYVEAGALMSYGPDFPQLWRRAAEYVDKILHGTKPADIPVEQPTKFDLIINLTTARALGLEIPETVVTRADELIE